MLMYCNWVHCNLTDKCLSLHCYGPFLTVQSPICWGEVSLCFSRMCGCSFLNFLKNSPTVSFFLLQQYEDGTECIIKLTLRQQAKYKINTCLSHIWKFQDPEQSVNSAGLHPQIVFSYIVHFLKLVYSPFWVSTHSELVGYIDQTRIGRVPFRKKRACPFRKKRAEM